MARKHGFFSTFLTLGGLAAVSAAVYRNRSVIREFINEVSGTFTPEEAADYEYETPGTEVRSVGRQVEINGEEPLIVIDHSGDQPEEEE